MRRRTVLIVVFVLPPLFLIGWLVADQWKMWRGLQRVAGQLDPAARPSLLDSPVSFLRELSDEKLKPGAKREVVEAWLASADAVEKEGNVIRHTFIIQKDRPLTGDFKVYIYVEYNNDELTRASIDNS